MINTKLRNKKRITNKKTDGFMDTTKIYNSPQFTDGNAGVNNIKKIKSKIALPESFAAEKVSKPINEQVEYLKSKKPLHVNDKNAIKVEKKLLKSFNVNASAADRLDQEVYKYENKLAQQKQQAVSLWDDVVNRSQQYIKLFEGVGNNSIFQNLAGLAARVIAPPPTANEILVIQDRIRRLDPSLITDVYVISQIVQSPELLAYLKNLYEHVKNNVATNKDLQYIINIVKPIIDYIAINSDRFSMGGSPWLVEAYNKIKGTIYNAPTFTPGTFAPAPVETSSSTFNFQSDSTAPPMERHTDAPTQTQTTEAPITQPSMPAPEPMQTPLVGNMLVIYEAYKDAFTTREKLVMFYNNLLGVGMSQAFMQIKQYVSRAPGVLPLVAETPTNILTTNLIGALNYIGTMPDWVITELTTRANEINTDPAFFFQPSPLKTSLEQSRGDILDYKELKWAIYKALENRGNLIIFIMDNIYKPNYLKSYPIFKNYIINESNKIDLEQGAGEQALLEKVETKVLFDIIYNDLVLLNESSLSEFISTIGNEMNILVNDPKFSLESGDIPYDIKTERLMPQPRTAMDATRPQSVPQLPASSNINLSKNEPQNINLVSRTGAAPVFENIENKINLSLIVPKKDKKYIDEIGSVNIFIMEYLFSLYTTLFNLGIGGLTKLFEQLPLIKKPKEAAEYIGDKFPPLTIGGGITIAIKAAYNLIKNIKMKKDQTKFIFSFINNIKSVEDIKTMFSAIQSNTIYFDVLADQILKNIKDKQELEMTFGKDTLRQKVIDTLMKSFININENNRLDTNFYEQTLTNVLVSLQELVNY
jgi:hypothetical protein